MSEEKEYPAAARFILADDVRHETNEKISIIGAYTGNEITITPRKPISGGQVFGIPLALLVVVEGGKGFAQAELRVISPKTKKPLLTADIEFDLSSARTKNLAFKFPTIPFADAGLYAVELAFKGSDKEPFKYGFNVVFGEPKSQETK